jgi:hypothetical protein
MGSNQAQRVGEFMRQKWRIYGLSDMAEFLSTQCVLRGNEP